VSLFISRLFFTAVVAVILGFSLRIIWTKNVSIKQWFESKANSLLEDSIVPEKIVEPEKKDADKKAEPPVPLPTVHDLFAKDFSKLLAFSDTYAANFGYSGALKFANIECLVLLDIDSNSKFLALYVPNVDNAFELIRSLPGQCETFVGDQKKHVRLPDAKKWAGVQLEITNMGPESAKVVVRRPGEPSATTVANLMYSHVVYIYFDDSLSLDQLATIEGAFKANGLTVKLRGQDWATTSWLKMKANLE
jgi:hypothetical protein